MQENHDGSDLNSMINPGTIN